MDWETGHVPGAGRLELNSLFSEKELLNEQESEDGPVVIYWRSSTARAGRYRA